MVIGIASSLVMVYMCLLIRSFEPDSIDEVSKTNSKCAFLGNKHFMVLFQFRRKKSIFYSSLRVLFFHTVFFWVDECNEL